MLVGCHGRRRVGRAPSVESQVLAVRPLPCPPLLLGEPGPGSIEIDWNGRTVRLDASGSIRWTVHARCGPSRPERGSGPDIYQTTACAVPFLPPAEPQSLDGAWRELDTLPREPAGSCQPLAGPPYCSPSDIACFRVVRTTPTGRSIGFGPDERPGASAPAPRAMMDLIGDPSTARTAACETPAVSAWLRSRPRSEHLEVFAAGRLRLSVCADGRWLAGRVASDRVDCVARGSFAPGDAERVIRWLGSRRHRRIDHAASEGNVSVQAVTSPAFDLAGGFDVSGSDRRFVETFTHLVESLVGPCLGDPAIAVR